MRIETRFVKSDVEVRGEGEGVKKIGGRAITYEQPSADMGFTEYIKRGAFDESIKNNVIKALWSHDSAKVLGSTANDTLTLDNREDGLYFTDVLPDTQDGRDAAVLIERGDVDGVSFGFFVIEQEWIDKDPDKVERIINKAELREISPVAFPAYEQNNVSLRSLYEEYKASEKKEEQNTNDLLEREIKLLEVEV